MKKPKPYKMRRLGILNAYGDVWTPETFDTQARAKRHIEKFYAEMGRAAPRAKFKIVPVNVTVSVAASK